MESMLSLALTALMVVAAMEFFGVGRTFFSRLKDRSEERRAALAALDKMEDDLREAGRGLAVPIGLGLITGLAAGGDRLTIDSVERELFPLADIQAGQGRVTVTDAGDIKSGRRLCLYSKDNAQVFEVISVQGHDLLINPEAQAHFAQEDSRLVLLTRVEYRLDDAAGVIRRKENGGGGQPLLESVSRLETTLDPEQNIVAIRLALQAEEGKTYECTIFPKNRAQTFRR